MGLRTPCNGAEESGLVDSCPLPIWNPVSSATLCSLKLPHVLGGKKAPEAASVSKALPWRRRNSNLMLEVHGGVGS